MRKKKIWGQTGKRPVAIREGRQKKQGKPERKTGRVTGDARLRKKAKNVLHLIGSKKKAKTLTNMGANNTASFKSIAKNQEGTCRGQAIPTDSSLVQKGRKKKTMKESNQRRAPNAPCI